MEERRLERFSSRPSPAKEFCVGSDYIHSVVIDNSKVFKLKLPLSLSKLKPENAGGHWKRFIRNGLACFAFGIREEKLEERYFKIVHKHGC